MSKVWIDERFIDWGTDKGVFTVNTSEHEHEWEIVTLYGNPPYAGCLHDWDGEGCSTELDVEEIKQILNNPTVKTMINVVIARRDDDD